MHHLPSPLPIYQTYFPLDQIHLVLNINIVKHFMEINFAVLHDHIVFDVARDSVAPWVDGADVI